MAYVELHAASAFSFLEGGTLPEELAARAADLRLPALALVDRNGVYGGPRFYKEAKRRGIKPILGAEVSLQLPSDAMHPAIRPRKTVVADAEPWSRLTLLIASRSGYQNLCRLITVGALGKEKGQGYATWEQLTAQTDGLYCLTGGDEGFFARLHPDSPTGLEEAERMLTRLVDLFPGRLYVELQRHGRRDEEFRNQVLITLARRFALPLVATNGVRYGTRQDKDLYDVLSCLRFHTTLEQAGARLEANREAHLKSPEEMTRLFQDLPQAIRATAELSEKLAFTLADLGYRFPQFPLPPGETADSYLRKLTYEGAQERFQRPNIDIERLEARMLPPNVISQLDKELAVIAKLGLAGYFLIVWEIVRFCKEEKILAQGRGSAANSAVCFALSITAVDPIKMELLFERFLSEERGEWPDIDIDLPSGDQREKVIQHLYAKYGATGCAMTANVITYQPRSAMREVAKVLGYTPEVVDKLAKFPGSLHVGEIRENVPLLTRQFRAAGFDIQAPKTRRLIHLWLRLMGLPRHLGQHSGGMVMAAGRLDEVVPLEPASMPGRVVIQWDKEDCADMGIIKVDLLGLGMLQAIEDATQLIKKHEGIDWSMASVPPDDPKVFAMLKKADTIGLFQVESRAQMASLPRNLPERFYDIVVQVAIIRPGPIQGGMVNPYYARRQGREPVTYAHPLLEPILRRTYGVPLFQEQVIRIASEVGGFTGGEAEELRRVMGWKRSHARMQELQDRLMKGMQARGIPPATCQQIRGMIEGFASYGFPESHAASFALIAYASGYLKAHHPTAFYIALLNAWPMGFYHPATLVKDAQRHNVEVLPVDVNFSEWDTTWHGVEPVGPVEPVGSGVTSTLTGSTGLTGSTSVNAVAVKGKVRLGLRFIKGLSAEAGKRISERRMAKGPFRDAEHLRFLCNLHRDEMQALAFGGAMGSFGVSRRAALWQVAQAGRPLGPLFEGRPVDAESPLPEMSPRDETTADYQSQSLTTGPHLMAYVRESLRARRIWSSVELQDHPNGAWVKTAGAIIVRQRPGSAKGFVFLTLEDEFGMSQGIIKPALYQKERATVLGSPTLIIEGVLQKDGANVSIRAERLEPLHLPAEIQSHDFH